MVIEDGPEFGEYLEQLRKERGMRVADLASRLNVSVHMVYEIQRGARPMSTQLLCHTAEILEVPRAPLIAAAARALLKSRGMWVPQ